MVRTVQFLVGMYLPEILHKDKEQDTMQHETA
jgi:hypothetical protein